MVRAHICLLLVSRVLL
jgi:hypothetical protein